MKIIHFFLASCILLSMLSCKKTDMPLAKKNAGNLDSLAANYYEQYLKLYPLEATAQGDMRYNDQLPVNISADFIAEETAFYKKTQQQLREIDYKKLPDEQKTVYDVLQYTLNDKIQRNSFHFENIPFTQFAGLPLDFPLLGSGEGSQPFKTQKDYENWLVRIDKFTVWMDRAIENFRAGMESDYVLPKKLVTKMIAQMRAEEIASADFDKNIFYGPVKKFPAEFSDAEKKAITKKFTIAITQKLIPAYIKMGNFLEKEYYPAARETDGIGTVPNGMAMYKYLVKSWTTTELQPAQIYQTGLQQVEMLRNEMEGVKKQVNFNGSLEEFLKHVGSDPRAMPYKTPEEVLAGFNGILGKINPKLKSMFGHTPKTRFEIRRTEKFREATASAEYLQGTADGKRPGIFYIPIPDATKFNVTSGMESLFLHEAIPGHHYQMSLQQENTKLPKFMRFGWFGAYGEGWAHYCETLGPEFGLYTDPYQKMGYLSDQMLRAVRLVIDVGLHTGKINREQAIKYFLDNVSYDEAAATAEVERYMAMPGQALGYKIGALKIRELRSNYEKALGKKFKLSNFHDEILSQGCLPLNVLERKMQLWAARTK